MRRFSGTASVWETAIPVSPSLSDGKNFDW